MTSDKELDYSAACAYIEDAAKLGSRPGLERIGALCKLLGNPQDELRFIHIAGTNGKGSTSCMISSILSEAHLKVGMYTSPAVSGIRDHYRICGELISESDYASAVSAVAYANETIIKDSGEGATQFELETAVAFSYFGANHCDAVILECGMGGRDDATNIVRNKICCVITSVSRDHMQYLGDTLTEIAAIKAGIITSDCPVIALDQNPEVTRVLTDRCRTKGARLYLVNPDSISSKDAFPLGQIITCEDIDDAILCMGGTFQAENAALAVRTVCAIRDHNLIGECRIDEGTIRSGLKAAKWPYRFELLRSDPLVFVDGAHNEDAASKLFNTIQRYLKGYQTILVMGVFADKEYDRVLNILSPAASSILTVETPDNPRALPAKELAMCAEKYCDSVTACRSIREAYELAQRSAAACTDKGERAAIVACGSLSYLKIFKDVVLESDDKGGAAHDGKSKQDNQE